MAKKTRVADRVEILLSRSQEYRDSDKKLLLAYWANEGFYLSASQTQAFMNCTPAESITRSRRVLRPKYPASEAVDTARFEKHLDYKNNRAFEPTSLGA